MPLVSDFTSAREVIKSPDQGLICPRIEDFVFGMDGLINSPEKRRNIAENFRTVVVSEFKWSATVDFILRVGRLEVSQSDALILRK